MSASRRILYHHRIRADDGQAVHVRELVTAMRLTGHDVAEYALMPKAVTSTASSTFTASPPTGDKPGFWQRLSLPRTVVEVLEVAYNHKGRAMLRAAARRHNPQFIYERHALHLRAGLDVARELDIPLLLEVNSPMVAEMQRLGKLCLSRRARRTEHHVLANADAVLAVTQVLADMLVELGAPRDRVHVIGNGAVAERYGSDTDLVLDVMKRPGLEAMVLILMGEGPALQSLQELALNHGLQDRVRALGVVPPDLLPAHVMACDGALIPAINDYASPLKLFDSLAAGVVTLAPDQPNLRENIVDGENGLLFAEGDGDALYAQLQRIVGDRALARRIGVAGKQSLIDQRWTWHGNAERVLEVFDSLPRRTAR